MAGYRPPYTADEENIMLYFIVQTKAHYNLRSKSLWEDMANSGFLDRTWQSLKEHFEKKILPDILNPKFEIPDIEKKIILLAYSQSAQ